MLLIQALKRLIPVIFIILAAIAVKIQIANKSNMFLETSDNKKIAAKLYKAENPKAWLILTHAMPETKESWDEFSKEVQKFGYESLVIDLRGHGESVGGPDGYKNFTDPEHQAGIKDLEAAWEFLKSRGATPDKTVLIGASIGANLCLQFLVNYPEISGGVLLSPGNYKGIDSSILVKKMAPNQKIIFAASRKDERLADNNASQNQEYYNLASQVKNRHLILFNGAGHGTELFRLKEEFNLTDAIMKFLDNGSIN